jgi:hypothetical protein
MEQQRPASRGSSVFSEETVENNRNRPLSRASTVSNDGLRELELEWGELGFYEPDEINILEWLENVVGPQAQEQPPPAAAALGPPPAAAALEADDNVQEPDSSTDWVVTPPLPLEDYTGPADSTSWWNK